MQGTQKKWIIASAVAAVCVIGVVIAVVTSADKKVEETITPAASIFEEAQAVTSAETVTPVDAVEPAAQVEAAKVEASEEVEAVVAQTPQPPVEEVQAAPAEAPAKVEPVEEVQQVAEVIVTEPAKPATQPAAEVVIPEPETKTAEVVEEVVVAAEPTAEKKVETLEPPVTAKPEKPTIEEVEVATAPAPEKAQPKNDLVVLVEEEAPKTKPAELKVEDHQKPEKPVVVVEVEEVQPAEAPEEVQEAPKTAEPQGDFLAVPATVQTNDNTVKPVTASTTLDGVAGGILTQTAYLLNPEPVYAKTFGKPSLSFRFTAIGDKDIETFSVSETLWERIELGYTLSRMGIGNLNSAVKKATLGTRTLGRDDIWLHVFNLRANIIKEQLDGWIPAVTAGVQFRINDGIDSMNSDTRGMFSALGMKDNFGIDYTLFASKTLPLAKRPLTISGGVRFTQAAEMGYLGFGDSYKAAFEGSVSYQLADWLVLGYEIKQNPNTLSELKGVIESERIWQAISANFLIGDNLSIQAAYGMLGKLANSSANDTWSIQLMYKF